MRKVLIIGFDCGSISAHSETIAKIQKEHPDIVIIDSEEPVEQLKSLDSELTKFPIKNNTLHLREEVILTEPKSNYKDRNREKYYRKSYW